MYLTKYCSLFLSICLISCSPHQNNTQSFVSNASTIPEPDSVFGKAICLSLDESVLWRKGDLGDALTKHIKSQTSIFVDNAIISKEEMLFVDGQVAHLEYEGDKVVGSWGGPLSLCFNVGNLKAGSHLAKIQLTTTTYESQSYEWTFKI